MAKRFRQDNLCLRVVLGSVKFFLKFLGTAFSPAARKSSFSACLRATRDSLRQLCRRGFFSERVDPDTQSRLPTAAEAEVVQKYVASRFPAMRNAPVVETRVCQYENTSNGDFLIDRHPQMENVWFVGGGSGHGFKHGPAVGEYVSQQILDKATPEPRYSLTTKETVQKRAVY
jgi:glycine/D-amino acid oxidase-like deaminating enzyme